MTIRPLDSGSQSWAKFVTLANAAKVRNAGFDLPLAPANNTLPKSRSAGVAKITGQRETGAMYNSGPVEKKQKPVLGTRFDAYA